MGSNRDLADWRMVALESGCELLVQDPDGPGMVVLDTEIRPPDLDWSREGF